MRAEFKLSKSRPVSTVTGHGQQWSLCYHCVVVAPKKPDEMLGPKEGMGGNEQAPIR